MRFGFTPKTRKIRNVVLFTRILDQIGEFLSMCILSHSRKIAVKNSLGYKI